MGVFDELMKQATKMMADSGDASGPPAGGLGSLFEKLLTQGGGLEGLVRSFQENGLGEVVQSWISTGKNQPINADQLRNVFGDKLQQMGESTGLSSQDLLGQLSKWLPTVVDRVTPDGQLPQGDLLGKLTQMLGQASG